MVDGADWNEGGISGCARDENIRTGAIPRYENLGPLAANIETPKAPILVCYIREYTGPLFSR